jgi:hypothetical protein
MPTFYYFYGIKINIYYRDHRPPHIHALYNEYEELLEIETLEIYKSWLPSRQHRLALEWLKNNQAEALENFYLLNPHLDATNKKNTKNNKGKRG